MIDPFEGLVELWRVEFRCWGESKADRIGDRPLQRGEIKVWAASLDEAQETVRARFADFFPTKELIRIESVNPVGMLREHIMNPEDGLHDRVGSKLVGV